MTAAREPLAARNAALKDAAHIADAIAAEQWGYFTARRKDRSAGTPNDALHYGRAQGAELCAAALRARIA